MVVLCYGEGVYIQSSHPPTVEYIHTNLPFYQLCNQNAQHIQSTALSQQQKRPGTASKQLLHSHRSFSTSQQNTSTMPATPKSFLPAFTGFMGTPPPLHNPIHNPPSPLNPH